MGETREECSRSVLRTEARSAQTGARRAVSRETNEVRSAPAWSWALLFPRDIQRALDRVEKARLVPRTPTLWQIGLGVARMWHRVLFRSDTIGTCSAHAVRSTWRARALTARPLRFPFLVRERAIAPLDFSGLASSRERILRHLLAAHHDGSQFAYDLEMLAIHEGALEELKERAERVVSGSDPRAEWLRDLVVFEGYHESLLAAVERALREGKACDGDDTRDPDISFLAYLRWCAAQPQTPAETLRAVLGGEISFAAGPVAP